jgi:putative ABC transport system permease protein
MLFLIGVYEGVKNGSTKYVLTTPAEIWVCQKNSTNLLRSSSFMRSSIGTEIQRVKGVGKVAGILRIIATAQINKKTVTLFIFGFDPKSSIGAPSTLIRGTSAIGPGAIILDKAFAAKQKLTVGDSLHIQGRNFRVSGISSGTNALVAQFAFTTLEDAQRLIGFPGIISFYLVNTDGTIDDHTLVDSLEKQFPNLAIFNKHEFVQNNRAEMETGVLPLLWTIVIFGTLVGTVIITLMLYGSILERREEYALLKAIGASHKFLVLLVIKQSLLGSLIGFICGFLLNMILTPLLIKMVPEISLMFTWQAFSIIFLISIAMGVIGSWAPLRKLARIYPAEVFRA